MHLRTKVAALAALAIMTNVPGTTLVHAAEDTAALTSVSRWRTVVYDDFNSGGVPSHWRAYNGPYDAGSCALPSHNVVHDGYLHLKFYYEGSSTAGKCGAAWYSGGLTLTRDLSAVSQRVTVRFRVVQSGGVSAHRVIPMRSPDIGGDNGGEQDYCESTPVTFCSTFIHWRDMLGRDRKKFFLDLTQFHTFQVTRNAYRVTVKIDGKLMWDFTGNSTSLPPWLHHVVLQQECIKTGCPTTKSGKEDIQIAWIRVENPA